MKKKRQKIFLIFAIALLVAAVAVAAWFFLFEREGLPLTIVDVRGNEMVKVSSPEDYAKDPRRAYLDIVIDEALSVLTEQIGEKKARETLWIHGYTAYTTFDQNLFDAVQIAEKTWSSSADAAIAVTDLQGNLLAAYSNSNAGFNFATAKHKPHSAWKPLSVYMQAIEAGKADWSTMYEDSPYKEIKTEDGKLQPWPSNNTGIYTNKKITLQEALKQSVNTVAVKCLADVGVGNSIKFLQEKLGLAMTYESKMTEVGGEDEVIGNVALGSLAEGVSAVDMAGYYQIFATEGTYICPQTLRKMENAAGENIYIRKAQSQQIISPETAVIMNRMLQSVVAENGTGAAAYCQDIQIAGKTGTGTDFTDNWFVGTTPQYSVAVWHGSEESNRAAELAGSVIRGLYDVNTYAPREFQSETKLQQVVYCTESGKAFGKHCTSIAMGWFAADKIPQQCFEH